MKRTKILLPALVANLLIVAMVALGTVLMMTGAAEGASLTATGLRALRYFTVDSNLLVGLAALLYAIALIRVLAGKSEKVSSALQTLLLAATASVGLTFLVVVCFFVPFLQAKDMFVGANFWFHLVIPLFSLASFVLLDHAAPLKKKAIWFGVVPMLLYGLFYFGNILLNGRGDYSVYATDPYAVNDWYFFLFFGVPVGIGIVLVQIGLTLGLTALLRLGNQALYRRRLPRA